jgi:hypothetical protein
VGALGEPWWSSCVSGTLSPHFSVVLPPAPFSTLREAEGEALRESEGAAVDTLCPGARRRRGRHAG